MELVCTLSDINDYILKGNKVASNIKELYIYLTDPNLRNIRVKRDFYENFFTATSYLSFVKEARRLNKLLKIESEVEIKSSSLDRAERFMKMREREELIDYVVRNKGSLKTLQDALRQTYDAKTEILEIQSKMFTTHLEAAKKSDEINTLKSQLNTNLAATNILRTNLDTLVSRINYSHEVDIEPSKRLGQNLTSCNYKSILYIKEITRVRYVDTLIYYLQEIIRVLYGKRVRLLVLETRDAYKNASLYPRCKPHTQLTYSDVGSSDIVCTGYQAKLVSRILDNPNDSDYLIIMDRTGADYPYIIGSGVVNIYTISTLQELPLKLPPEDVISYSNTTLYIPHIADFENLSREARVSKYSSLPIFKSLLSRMEN